jgi:hypothetical protein
MASIIQAIGTPLQLIALFLLLVFGVLRLLVRSGKWTPSPSMNRLIVNWTFRAALAMMVLGMVSSTLAPVLERWLNHGETFHGAVLSTTGDPIPGATINMITIGTVTTNGVGQFDITVPPDRLMKEYKIQAKAIGYETPPALTKSSLQMQNLEIRLTPIPQELIKSLERPLYIGQYYGYPFVLVTLRVENIGSAMTSISEIRGTLTNQGTTIVLSSGVWTIGNLLGPYDSVDGPFPIFAGARLDLRVLMIPGMNLTGLISKVKAIPEYQQKLPCMQNSTGSIESMNDAAYNLCKTFADEHFSWIEGEWHLKIEAKSENQTKTFDQDFTLSQTEVDHLRTSIGLLKQCLAANPNLPLAQDGRLTNFLQK